MGESPFVSIIIPAWNDESVLPATLDAIKNVDYPKERCEIIVVAGGLDGTYSVAEKYSDTLEAFYRFALLKQEPLGKNAALQKGLGEINNAGDFVVFLDADTILEKDWLLKIIREFEIKNFDVINGNYYPMKKINHVSAYFLYEKIKYKKIDNVPTLYGGGGIVFKREILENEDPLELFNENVPAGVDYYLGTKLIEKNYSIGFAEDAKSSTYIPSTIMEFVEVGSRWINALLKITYREKLLDGRILKNFALIFSLVFSIFLLLLGSPAYLYIIAVPFLVFGLKTTGRGLRVYLHERDTIYLKYLVSYFFFSLVQEVLITLLFLKMKLFGLKQNKHFKGPRPG
jgi:cellulose synthase/poly-beta-1,6-N-acetylglucosamine synthase-like glycosyltransferase